MKDLRDQRLKAATRELHVALGGVEGAASVTGKSKTHHGRFHSRDYPDFATIRDIALMEAAAPDSMAHPQVTRLLCELAGGVYIPLPQMPESDEAPALMIARLAGSIGDVSMSIAEGLSDDGKLDGDEAAAALRKLTQVERTTAQLRALLQAIEDESRT